MDSYHWQRNEKAAFRYRWNHFGKSQLGNWQAVKFDENWQPKFWKKKNK